MPNQTARQQARRSALDAQARMRAKRAERDRRCSALAVQVVTALAQRDALAAACETRAGEALVSLTEKEGLSLREAVQWCGSAQLTVREATRLRQVAGSPGLGGPVSDDEDDGPDDDERGRSGAGSPGADASPGTSSAASASA